MIYIIDIYYYIIDIFVPTLIKKLVRYARVDMTVGQIYVLTELIPLFILLLCSTSSVTVMTTVQWLWLYALR